MKYEVDQFIKRHHIFKTDSTLIVGVSGGPDSMALLDYLNKIKRAWNFQLIAASVDHSLRGEESKADLAYVERYCKERDIQFEGATLDVPSYKRKYHVGTQEAARAVRYQFFSKQMETYQADYLVLAQHGDDQIETMYMKMTRGSNPAYLTGIAISRPFSTGKLVRPLLSVTKSQIEAYCTENELNPRRDTSNQEDVYTRNFFRIHILPLLKQKNPNLHQSVQHLSENMTTDMELLNTQAKEVSKEVLKYHANPKKVTCSINQMKKHHPALQRRMFHLILNYLYDHRPSGLFYGHERQFFDLLHSERANVSVDLPAELTMVKSYQNLSFHFRKEKATDFSIPLKIPGIQSLPHGGSVHTSIISARELENEVQDKMSYYYPLISELSHPLLFIRNRLPGDKIRLKGLQGHKKVKNIFIDEKVPLYKRNTWPILVDAKGRVLWVLGFAKAEHLKETNIKGVQFVKIEYRE